MHTKSIVYAGMPLGEARKALIMIHGRGASPQDIISLAGYLNVSDYALLAPRATGNTWYPYSFMAPRAQNEPWLSAALSVLSETVQEVVDAGIARENIYFLGFSQGACLTLEFVTRNAVKWGGVAAFTGGLIGDALQPESYTGDFAGTPCFIGTANPDPHVPVQRVHNTAAIMQSLHASVKVKIYNGLGHTISEDEINHANTLIFK